MKPTGYIASIAQPCHERWDEMTPASRGKHCAACSTTVVDLSGLSDAELALFLQQQKEPFCGRFRKGQLDRPVPVPAPPMRYPVLKKWLASALLVIASGTVGAQQVPPPNPELPPPCDDTVQHPQAYPVDTVTAPIEATPTPSDSSVVADSIAPIREDVTLFTIDTTELLPSCLSPERIRLRLEELERMTLGLTVSTAVFGPIELPVTGTPALEAPVQAATAATLPAQGPEPSKEKRREGSKDQPPLAARLRREEEEDGFPADAL